MESEPLDLPATAKSRSPKHRSQRACLVLCVKTDTEPSFTSSRIRFRGRGRRTKWPNQKTAKDGYLNQRVGKVGCLNQKVGRAGCPHQRAGCLNKKVGEVG